MHSAVNVRVVKPVVIVYALYNAQGLLSGSGIVEINEIITVNLAFEYGEVLSYTVRVKFSSGLC